MRRVIMFVSGSACVRALIGVPLHGVDKQRAVGDSLSHVGRQFYVPCDNNKGATLQSRGEYSGCFDNTSYTTNIARRSLINP